MNNPEDDPRAVAKGIAAALLLSVIIWLAIAGISAVLYWLNKG